MTGFTFNGTTSQSLGLLVTALNPYNSASRRVETIEIPYRNGNLIIDSGTYDNIMVSYEVSVIGNTKTTCDAVNEWLSGSQGYCILSDTVNTEFFRVGYFASSIEYVLTALYREGKATLNFDCFPQKYLNSNTTITRNATSTTETDISGTTFSSHVYPLPIDLKGNTSQSGTPTPTSPQDVHNVSGDNSVIVCGKNMFRDYITGSITSRGVTRTGGDNCVILNGTYDQQANLDLFLTRSTSSSGTANMTLMKANTSYAISVYFLNDYSLTSVTMLRVSTWSLDKTTFEWNGSGNPDGLVFDGNVAKGIYSNGNTPLYIGGIRMALASTRSATFNDCIVKIQVEEANAVTPFEEYKGITYPINLPVELNKIGTYQDYIYKSGNKWYLHKEVGKIVLDGTEGWSINYNQSLYDYTGITTGLFIPNSAQLIVSNYFISRVYSDLYNEVYDYGISFGSSAGDRLCIRNKDIVNDVASFKTWLSTSQPIVYYVLATPTTTEITDATLLSQLNAIDSAMAFETSTTIAQVNNDAPFLLTYTNIGSATVTSNYRGEPIITVNDTGYIYINGASIKVNQVPMTINSQTMQAYNGNINLNNYIEINEFPMLKKGNNDIGSTMALSIVPNYWKL